MIGPIGWEEFHDRQTDRQTDRRQTDRQTEKSNPSVPYDTFPCFAGLIIITTTIICKLTEQRNLITEMTTSYLHHQTTTTTKNSYNKDNYNCNNRKRKETFLKSKEIGITITKTRGALSRVQVSPPGSVNHKSGPALYR